jgi:hypothetical protein
MPRPDGLPAHRNSHGVCGSGDECADQGADNVLGAGRAGDPRTDEVDRAYCTPDQMTTDSPVVAGACDEFESGEQDIEAAAVAAYRASIDSGSPLSERKLDAMFGRTSRRWARNRLAEAR